ncbi:sensor histidine kinase [Spirochaetota bacterium]
MIKKTIKKIWGSIFFKLVIILIVTGFLINIFVGFFFRLQVGTQGRPYFRAHLKRYTQYIVSEMGSPPELDKAKKIADELSIKIKYTGKNNSWMTHKAFPELKYKKRFFKRTSTNVRWNRGKLIYILNKDEGKYIFVFNPHQMIQWEEEYVFILLLIVTITLLIAYLLIRNILKPIKWLTKGVEEIGNGNFNHQVSVRKEDDLGELTRAFNAMGKRIGEMLRARDQLLLDVSHELRSPITRIKVALEFVKDEEIRKSMGDDISDIDKMISEILEEQRLNNIFGKIQKENVKTIDFVKDTVKSYENKHPGIKITVEDDMEMNVDVERMKIVMKNILDNAFKYATVESKPVEISVIKKEKQTHIVVRDYGSGIPGEDLPNIFEPFYRVDRSRSKETGGYGLGLSLSKRIMEAHGGAIEIDSRLNEGTTVFLSFE